MTRPFSPQASGNKVSRQSVLCGSQNIVLNGKVGGGEGAAEFPRPGTSFCSAGWEGSAAKPLSADNCNPWYRSSAVSEHRQSLLCA